MIRTFEMLSRRQSIKKRQENMSGTSRKSSGNSRKSPRGSTQARGSVVMKMLQHMGSLMAKRMTWTSPLDRFRRISRLVLVCVSWCRFSYQKAEETKKQLLSVTQFSDDPIVSGDQGLLFDMSKFKTNREHRISQEARRVLKSPTDQRTEKDLKYVQVALRSLKAFVEYPMRMQKKLCQVGWYEGYESKRAIVRQGHPPHAFYFILSGTVVVTVLDEESQISHTLCFLHRGMEFGELALVSKSIRQATVVSKTPVELLCISVEDFEDIFMSGGLKNVNDPDHVSFIRHISFMQHFPIEKLSEDRNKCVFHYFNRGQVLVRDSNNSDWIFIVKSGSVSVMKKLVKVKPIKEKDKVKTKRKTVELPPILDSNKDLVIKNKDFIHLLSTECITRKRTKTWPSIEVKTDMDYPFNSLHTLPPISMDKCDTSTQEVDTINNQNTAANDTPSEENNSSHQTPLQRPKIPTLQKNSKGAYLASATEPNNNESSRNKLSNDKDLNSTDDKNQTESRDDGKVVGRKTISDDLDNRPSLKTRLTEADLYPTFIVAQVLERGQYFGLSEILFDEQPSFSLVSNGADCLLISKKLFLDNTPEVIISKLRRMEVPYPADEEMQSNLHNYVTWKQQRSHTYKQVVNNVLHRKTTKKQWRAQNGGQYNFRAGPMS